MPVLVEPERYLEILQPDRCPLCFLVQNYIQGHMRSLLDECATDPITREDLFRSKGFCRRHAWSAVQQRQSLAMGIIYASLLAKGIEKLSPYRHWRAPKAKPCLLCESEEKCEQTFQKQFALNWAHSEKLREAFQTRGILCLPHLEGVLNQKLDKPHRESLLEAGKKALEPLVKDLNEFLEKQDYHRSKEASGKEWDAWIRAVRVVNGERE